MSVPTYNQTDARWGNIVVGFAQAPYNTFKYIGCTVCDLTYLHNTLTKKTDTPNLINEKLKKAQAFVKGEIYWPRVQFALPEMKFVYRDYNYNNARAWSWINASPKLPLLVEVFNNASVTKKHWVTFIGGGKMYNPATGQIQPTSTYPILTGDARLTRA